MKRFNLSKHFYYLFKPEHSGAEQKSREDVFVPKIFMNLYNITKKIKKQNMKAHNNNETKFFLLNSNSYFSHNQMAKMNTFDINNNYVANKIFGNNKRYFSTGKKSISNFPNVQRNSISNKFQKFNSNNSIKQNQNLILRKKLAMTNTKIKVKNIEYPKEMEKNKEDKSRRLINLSVEYMDKDKFNDGIFDLESFSIRNGIELSSKKLSDINQSNIFHKKIKNKIYNNYKDDKLKGKKYNSKILMKSIHYLSNLNKSKENFHSDYSYYLKKNMIPQFAKLVRQENIKILYKTEKEILDEIYKSKIDFPLVNDNDLYPTEKFYFCINRRYRNQLIKYMNHRINWEFYANSSKYYDNININFEWKYYSHKVNFKKFLIKENMPLKKLKIINLFEKNYEIGNKKNMFINLISYCDSIGYNIFDVVPFTIIISNTKNLGFSFSALKELLEFIPKESNLKNNIMTNRRYCEQFWFDKNYYEIYNQYIYFNKNFLSKKNYWILKPPDLYQGKCIEIVNNYDEILKKCKKMFRGVDKTNIPELDEEEYDDEYDADEPEEEYDEYEIKPTKFYCCNDIIVQKYLDNPLLYYKRKFDIRCFVLLDSNLNVYFCREGHLKGCSEFYDLENTNKFIHITNYSFQKNSSNFEKFEKGNEISYSDFKKFMKKENIPLEKFDKMIEHMKFLIQLSLKAVSKKLTKVNPVLCFEIFGYDFIVDNEFRPWILEINDNPGLCISSPVIEKIIPRMLDDAFRLTIDVVFNTKYSPECFDSKKRYKSKFKLDGFTDNENIFEFLCNLN